MWFHGYCKRDCMWKVTGPTGIIYCQTPDYNRSLHEMNYAIQHGLTGTVYEEHIRWLRIYRHCRIQRTINRRKHEHDS